MSNVNAQATVRRIRRGGTETILLAADVGDIVQDIIGTDGSGGVIVAPDFAIAANQPSLFPVITVSTKTGQVIPSDEKWYYNSAAITFNASGLSTGTLAGVFQKVTRSSDGMPGLKIVKNLASSTNKDNDTIGFDGAIDTGGFSRRISKDYTILIQERTGEVRVGTISYPDGKNGVIETQTDSIQLKANLREGNNTIPTTDYTVRWKKLNGTNWVPLTNESGTEVTGYTVTVTEGMVNSFQLIMCEFYGLDGVLITTDTAPVTDASDPLIIMLNPTPEDETISADDDVVKYTPMVVSRSAPTSPIAGYTYTYAVLKKDGTVYRSGTGTSFTVGIPDSDATGGGSVDVSITAEK